MNINQVQIVTDSSSDIKKLDTVGFSIAPLKITCGNTDYIDDENLDVENMVNTLAENNQTSSTACPSPADWQLAFNNAEYVFCISITSQLSGSYNSASIAAKNYEEEFPQRKVFVIDSLSTGPEMVLIAEKIEEYVISGLSFEEVCENIKVYMSKTRLIFMLESMKNLANNGRVKHIVAKAVGLLGIRIVGKASDEGTLEILDKHRGEKRALSAIARDMKNMGYKNGKLKIGHCLNEEAAFALKENIEKLFGHIEADIYPLGGLTSYYAEKGGLILGFEIE